LYNKKHHLETRNKKMILGTYGKSKKIVSLEEIEAKNQKYNEIGDMYGFRIFRK
jgi:hypothetical protein